MSAPLLSHLEWYLDAAPRLACEVEHFGPLTLFISRSVWPYYARPTLTHTEPPVARDVELVRRRQRELGQPEAFEWVHENCPLMREAAQAAGLIVRDHPLMVLTTLRPAAPPNGISLRTLKPSDPDLAAAQAVAQLGFGAPGTDTGTLGVEARDARMREVQAADLAHVQTRLRRGLTRMVIAIGQSGYAVGEGPLCVGSSIPIGSTAEIVGIATLPAARHRGLARAVTTHLVQDAQARGVETIFLTAGSEAVAQIYFSLGFIRIGTSCIAEATSS